MIDPTTSSDSVDQLDDILDRFELSWSPDLSYLVETVENGGLQTNLKGITELIRADIDRRYASDCDVELRRYFEWFPALTQDAFWVEAIAFEDFRSRKTRGLAVHPNRWSWMPNIQSVKWLQELRLGSSLVRESAANRVASVRGDTPLPRVEAEPQIGEKFGDFQILAELGTGAFSKVYLATQPSLASRYVALKIVKKTLNEPEHLARLQHTGIVPIYSLHRMESYSVLCMPYYGAATLADWLGGSDFRGQRNGQSLIGTVQQAQTRIGSSHSAEVETANENAANEVDRIRVWNAAGAQPLSRLTNLDPNGCLLWLSRRIASALTHAHERDVVHGDLKPANILLKNDGEPALIDFNLARNREEVASSHVGGTLPYMSPEQLQVLLGRRLHLSAASDVYSLGLILFQIVEDRLPFPAPLSAAESDISVAIQHRKLAIRFDETTISSGIKSIIAKCLEYDPKNRYASGAEILEDLDCENSNLPLKHAKDSFFRSRIFKLGRRYPRLFSVAPVLVIATLFIGILASASFYWWRQSQQWNSRESLSRWTSQMSVHLPKLLEGSDEEIRASFQTIGEAIDSLTENKIESGKIARFAWMPADERQMSERGFCDDLLLAAGLASERRSQLRFEQVAKIDRWLVLCQRLHLSQSKIVKSLRSSLDPTNSRVDPNDFAATGSKDGRITDGEKILQARGLCLKGLYALSIETLTELTPRGSSECLYWITVGDAQKKLGHQEAALHAYGLAIHKAADATIGYSRRSQLLSEMRKWSEAEKDCTKLIELQPSTAYRYAERARVRESLGKNREAIVDMDDALNLEPNANSYYFFRSTLEQKAKNLPKAKEDFRKGINLTPETVEDWISRALAQLPRYPEKAMEDLKKAEMLQPDRFEVLQNQAHVLSDYLHDESAAAKVLSLILENDPENVWARVDRCVLLARAGNQDEALADIERVLSKGNSVAPATYYQVACAHSLLANRHPDCREQSLHFLSKAIISGYGHDLLETDSDLDPIRSEPKFTALLEVTQLSKRNKTAD